jgi:hypothetical protein
MRSEGIEALAYDGGSEASGTGVPPPRVFWEKRLQVIENKGWGVQKERQEAASCWKERVWSDL